jgi:hypothetical protein
MAKRFEFLPADTTPEAARVQLEAYRRMSSARRLELAFQMSDALRRMVVEGVRQRHAEYSADQVRLAVARLSLGEELFAKVYPGVAIEV